MERTAILEVDGGRGRARTSRSDLFVAIATMEEGEDGIDEGHIARMCRRWSAILQLRRGGDVERDVGSAEGALQGCDEPMSHRIYRQIDRLTRS